MPFIGQEAIIEPTTKHPLSVSESAFDRHPIEGFSYPATEHFARFAASSYKRIRLPLSMECVVCCWVSIAIDDKYEVLINGVKVSAG